MLHQLLHRLGRSAQVNLLAATDAHAIGRNTPGTQCQCCQLYGAIVDYVPAYLIDAAKMGKVNSDMRLMLLEAFENEEVPVSKSSWR